MPPKPFSSTVLSRKGLGNISQGEKGIEVGVGVGLLVILATVDYRVGETQYVKLWGQDSELQGTSIYTYQTLTLLRENICF